MNYFDIACIVLYIVLSINVLYLLIFSVASLKKPVFTPSKASNKKRFAILIAAYREDGVIDDTVKACLNQNYPQKLYDVVVISDHMSQSTNDRLRLLPIKLLQVDFEESSNTKSLKAAMEYLGKDQYDIVLILDADNIIFPDFIEKMNEAFCADGVHVVQAHRIAKNIDTDMALLDAISEEINNSIFRLGHVNLGMSSALIGSGMAFDYNIFYDAIMRNDSVGGFDRVLELMLLYKKIHIHYLPNLYVLDEKVRHTQNFYKQRRRWLSAQFYSFLDYVKHFPKAVLDRKWDFCDKLLQQSMPSRVMLLGFIFVATLAFTLFRHWSLWLWTILLFTLFLTLVIAIPQKFVKSRGGVKRILTACYLIPVAFAMMILNLFKLKEANKKFIHTQHGTTLKE